MSIATQIERITKAKADIKTEIENASVTVPSSATIDTYPEYIKQAIQSGSYSQTINLTGANVYVSDKTLVIEEV